MELEANGATVESLSRHGDRTDGRVGLGQASHLAGDVGTAQGVIARHGDEAAHVVGVIRFGVDG